MTTIHTLGSTKNHLSNTSNTPTTVGFVNSHLSSLTVMSRFTHVGAADLPPSSATVRHPSLGDVEALLSGSATAHSLISTINPYSPEFILLSTLTCPYLQVLTLLSV